ncbi:hypothetical protein GOP47_0012302 [Adiantum capillus-veneris]|uniref:Secreted protein n=1 Tax=Adiantum capillus-veneris TaxID=13818 RepID=A0A9D4UR53_ADICA|nr:hypothetical protein GOP47_0012302 [Adiantum capillus-veneris]
MSTSPPPMEIVTLTSIILLTVLDGLPFAGCASTRFLFFETFDGSASPLARASDFRQNHDIQTQRTQHTHNRVATGRVAGGWWPGSDNEDRTIFRSLGNTVLCLCMSQATSCSNGKKQGAELKSLSLNCLGISHVSYGHISRARTLSHAFAGSERALCTSLM